MIRLTIIAILLCECLTAFGQYRMSGKVVEDGSGSLIKVADVYLLEQDLLQKGSFNFDKLEAGDYTLIIFGLGYNTVERQVHLVSDTTLTFTLSPLQNQLTEVVIQDQKDEIFAMRRLRAVEGTAIYAGKKSEVVRLEKMMGNIAANNSRQIYAQVAGLNIYEGNDGGLQLAIGGRGLDPNRTANFNTRQNGYDISADVLGYPESYFTPPAEALEEIQIVRGAASLQYGTQFGGLINFKTYTLPESKNFELITNQTIASFGFLNSYNYVGLRHGKWTLNAYFNYREGDGYRSNSSFNARNFFASAQYDFNRNTSLKLETTLFNYLAQQPGGLTDEEFESNPRQSNRERNWFTVDWKLYNALLQHKFSSRSELSLSIFALDASRFALGYRGNPIDLNQNPITAIDEQSISGEYISPRDLIKGTFNNYGAEIRFLKRYQIKDKNAVWLIGAKYYRAENTSNQGPGSSAADANFSFQNKAYPDYPNQSSFNFPNRNFSLFSEHIFYLSDNLSLTPGLRFEHIKTESAGEYNVVQYDIAGNPINNRLFDEAQSFPRNLVLLGLGLSYKPSDFISGFANISQNYRSVTFSDIRTVNPTFIIDPSISDERGFTSDIGMRGRWKDICSFEAGIYSIFYNDRIGIILDDRANRVRKNIGNAVIYGLETLVEFNLLPSAEQTKLKWFSNLALTESRYTSSEENNVVGKKVEFIPFVNLKTGLNAGYRNVTTNLQFTYLSSQYTDVQNSLRREPGDSRSGIVGEIPSYSIFDWSLAIKLKKVTLNSGINNLLNSSYFTRRATGYPGPGILPSEGRSFYVTLGIKI